MLMQIFGVTNKEHYGMLWYFLEWSTDVCIPQADHPKFLWLLLLLISEQRSFVHSRTNTQTPW